jgi:hypothetical protein
MEKQSSATTWDRVVRHMKSTFMYCACALTAFAAAGLMILRANSSAPLTHQPQEESSKAGDLRSFDIVQLETVSETSANASIGDLNGDGFLDIVLAKGRHWPVPSRIFFGDGKGHFTPGPPFRVKPPKPIQRLWPI